MFRLKATLVEMTRTQPWRTGWSVDRGVDFSLAATIKSVTVPCAARDDRVAAEPASFIDEDQTAPSAAAVARARISPAAVDLRRDPVSGETSETSGLRAWWSLSGKPSGV